MWLFESRVPLCGLCLSSSRHPFEIKLIEEFRQEFSLYKTKIRWCFAFISRTSCQTIGWKVITFVKCIFMFSFSVWHTYCLKDKQNIAVYLLNRNSHFIHALLFTQIWKRVPNWPEDGLVCILTVLKHSQKATAFYYSRSNNLWSARFTHLYRMESTRNAW